MLILVGAHPSTPLIFIFYNFSVGYFIFLTL